MILLLLPFLPFRTGCLAIKIHGLTPPFSKDTAKRRQYNRLDVAAGLEYLKVNCLSTVDFFVGG
jgi:hypothetical protein